MVAQLQNSQVIGFDPVGPTGGVATTQVNAAANLHAYSFVAQTTTTISGFRAFCSVKTGSPIAADIVATLYSDGLSTGGPLASLSGSSVSDGITASAWTTWTTWTGTLTITTGVRYWIVISNANAVPASNFPTFQYGTTNTGDGVVVGNAVTWGYAVADSTNTGTSWPTTKTGACGWRVDLADGTYLGLPALNVAVSTTTNQAFGANEVGAQFTTPSTFPKMNVFGIAMNVGRGGSPTGTLAFKLYSVSGGAGTLIATTATFPVVNIGITGQWITLYFSSQQQLSANTTYAVTMLNSNADSSSNAYRTILYTLDSDSHSTSQVEFSMVTVQTANSGTAFNTVANTIVPWAIVLDSTGEFTFATSVEVVNVAVLDGPARVMGY